MEVPEIEDNVIDIRAIARQPGERAKIIVQSHDRRIDPVGACVGMRGSRIQAIVRELNNEKIDIVNYSEQSEILISRALSPAKPLDLYIDDDRKYCIAIFDDDDLELAIGRGGVNVNLAAKLTEYRIDAFGKKEYERKQIEQETLLADIDGMPARAVKPLGESGITSVSDLLNSDEDTLLEIKGISENSLEKIYDAVQNFVEANQAAAEPEDTKEEVQESDVDLVETGADDEAVEVDTDPEPEVVTAEDVPDESEETLKKVES